MQPLKGLLSTRPNRRAALLVGIVLWGVFVLALLLSSRTAMAAPGVLTEYPIPGQPLNLVVQAPGRVWFTLPESNAIGSLVVTSTLDYKFTQYDAPTAGATPYDLAYDGQGSIWFTEKDGNRIARLTISTGLIQEYPVPTPNSAPTGIAVGPDGVVWFTERDGDKLGRFDPTTETFTEFPYQVTGGGTEDVVVHRDGQVRISAPNVNQVFGYRPDTQLMYSTPTHDIASNQPVEEPWSLMLDSRDVLWITARRGNRLGRFMPGTVTFWRWFILPAGSAPTGIAFDRADGLSRIWFTLSGSGRTGQLVLKSTGDQVSLGQFRLPSPQSGPTGIAVDAQGHVWIAETGTQRIAEWRPPYFERSYFHTLRPGGRNWRRVHILPM